MRIEVRIVDYNRVGGRQIDAEAAGARRQQENELRRTGRIEAIDRLLSELTGDAAVNALIPKHQTYATFYSLQIDVCLLAIA